MKIEKTVALVTGGANDIGRAIAGLLADRGASTVAVHYRSSEKDVAETCAMVTSLGAEAIPLRADISDEQQVRAMVEGIVSRCGRLDILVNNAATRAAVDYNDLDGLTDEAWDDLYHVNVLGPFRVARAARRALSNARGAIVNIASIAGYRSVGSSLHYGVSKAALLQLTRGLARALAPEVRVNAVSPGTVDTRWHRGQQGAGFDKWATSEIVRMPLGRLVHPEDIALAVAGFIESEMLTGEEVIVDGGRHLLY
jgi:3-oxoacyl-[acyl-carrier protein] reductase